jgi:hypothetical protein
MHEYMQVERGSRLLSRKIARHAQVRLEDEDREFLQEWSRQEGISQQELLHNIIRGAIRDRKKRLSPRSGTEDVELLRAIRRPATREEIMLSRIAIAYLEIRGSERSAKSDHEK